MLFQKGHIPWNKELKGIHLSPNSEFKKGNSGYWKGKKRDFQTIQKIKKAHKGKHYSLRTELKKGYSAWNKGKKFPEFSGENHLMYNKHHSKETKLKMKEAKLRNPTNYWLGKERVDIKGEKNPFWKGGITPLEHLIKESLEYKDWRANVYKRDNFMCKDCGSKKSIEAHHLKSFTNIFQEFLQRYNQFSPIEDKETLLRLSFTYESFWDVSNGKTLCEKCHKSLKRLFKYQEVTNG